MVVVETENGSKAGLVVDELIGQQQVVVKSLAEYTAPVPGISGATILGNGRVALILDVEGICSMPDPSAFLEAPGDFQWQAGSSPDPQAVKPEILGRPEAPALQNINAAA